MVNFNGDKSFALPRDFRGRRVDVQTVGGVVEKERVFCTKKAAEQSYLALGLGIAPVLVALRVELDHFAARGAALVAFVVCLFLSPWNLQSLEEAIPLGHGEAAASAKTQQEVRANGVPQELHARRNCVVEALRHQDRQKRGEHAITRDDFAIVAVDPNN